MKKIKILIVEDEASIVDIYSIKLNEEGFEVSAAANGQEGLQKAVAEMPDLILLDILMPVMDGLTMLGLLRKKNEYGNKVPVILLTNLSAGNENIITKVAETEPLHYIVKSSSSLEDVVKKIKE